MSEVSDIVEAALSPVTVRFEPADQGKIIAVSVVDADGNTHIVKLSEEIHL